MDRNLKAFAAELIGTAVLMIGGPGSAILASKSIGVLGVALAFGFSLLVLAYAIGGISGCHVNPAVSLAMLITKKINVGQFVQYVVAQLLGGFIGGLIIWIIAKGQKGFDATNNFAANGYGKFSPGGYNLGAAIVAEIVLTALLCFVVLSSTHRKFHGALTGLAVGLTLALIHLISIPVDNTSVNPARSFGAAIFAGSDALKQLWAFVVFPLIGAVLGVLVWLAVDDGKLEDTMLGGSRAMTAARDAASGAVHRAADMVEKAVD
jgi:aquaporin Z